VATKIGRRFSSKAGRIARSAKAGVVTPTGAEVWTVVRNGRRSTVVTSKSSAAAMDEAVRLYAGALKRLAKR